jgi:hypothetical protein
MGSRIAGLVSQDACYFVALSLARLRVPYLLDEISNENRCILAATGVDVQMF